MYSQEQLKAVYRAIKGIGKIGDLSAELSVHRHKVKEQFFPTIETVQDVNIIDTGVQFLKEADVLKDAQLLVELLNS